MLKSLLTEVVANSGFTFGVFDLCEKPCTPTEMLSHPVRQNPHVWILEHLRDFAVSELP